MNRLKLFISSVQKELAAERRAIRSFVDSDPLLRRFFEGNHRVCEGLFLVRYIEKFGTGTLMMIRECRAHALPEPDFLQRSGELVTTVWRDWLTEKAVAELSLNERQRNAVLHFKTRGQMSNAEFQRLCGVPHRTAVRDLMGLVRLGVLDHEGTGRGAVYVLRRNRAINVPMVPPPRPPILLPADVSGDNHVEHAPNVPAATPGSASARPASMGQRAPQKSAISRPGRPSAQSPRKRNIRGTKEAPTAKPTGGRNVPNVPSAAQPPSAGKRAEGRGMRDENRGMRTGK